MQYSVVKWIREIIYNKNIVNIVHITNKSMDGQWAYSERYSLYKNKYNKLC